MDFEGSCLTYGNNIGDSYEVTTINDSHNHAPDPIKLKHLEKRWKIKTKALNSNEPPRVIIAAFENEIQSKEGIVNSTSYDADRQAINRTKMKVKPDYPPEPSDLSEINVPEWLKYTLGMKEELFLIYDSGKLDPDRFYIFSTESNLKRLEQAHWFGDGTFDAAPKLFKQVYTIDCVIHNKCFPMLYGLLTRKTQSCYIKFLEEIAKHLYIHPISISIDFEKAFINAIARVFPDTIIYLCYFHFKFSMWRQITDEGLRNAYLNNEAIRKMLKLPQVRAPSKSSCNSGCFKESSSSINIDVVPAFNAARDLLLPAGRI